MNAAAVIGGVAALCSIASFVPQAFRVIRTNAMKDISTGMYVLTVTGFTLWTAYGVMTVQWPVIAANALCLALSAFILTMKLLPSGTRKSVTRKLR